MAFSLTALDTQYTTGSLLGLKDAIKENFAAMTRGDSDIWSGQNLSGYGASTATTFTLFGSSGGANYETLEIGSNRADADATRAGSLAFFANINNASYKALAAIDVFTDGATANKRGGQFRFLTRPDNSTTMTERMRITSAGSVSVGGVSPTSLFHVCKGSSGSTLSPTITQITAENNGDAGVEIAFPNANIGRLLFTAPGSTALIRWDHTNLRMDIGSAAAAGGSIRFVTGNFAEAAKIDTNQNFVIGTAALATGATNGFPYIPTCAGTPTGAPTAFTGRIALIYDSTNNKLYGYNGAWKSVTLT